MAISSTYIFIFLTYFEHSKKKLFFLPRSLVKMEYGWTYCISGLKMMFLKFLHALTMLFLLLNLYFWSKFNNKNDQWANGGISKKIPGPLFIIIFRPEMLKFHPYSILTGDTRVEFVIYCVFCVFFFSRLSQGLKW